MTARLYFNMLAHISSYWGLQSGGIMATSVETRHTLSHWHGALLCHKRRADIESAPTTNPLAQIPGAPSSQGCQFEGFGE